MYVARLLTTSVPFYSPTSEFTKVPYVLTAGVSHMVYCLRLGWYNLKAIGSVHSDQ
jgi:hypothetical protein